MRTVLIRDDDTNATTPPECLELLYKPFLDRSMTVNLAVIPEVALDARRADGDAEAFVVGASRNQALPIASNPRLCNYLRERRFGIMQHGLRHERPQGRPEFDSLDRQAVAMRLERGRALLEEAGLGRPQSFVAPYDRLSGVALEEAARRFRVISTGWYEWRRLPWRWLPRYAVKRLMGHPHWRVGGTRLLSHPGCLLSCHHPTRGMFERVRAQILRQPLTVLVTHWWEYFDSPADPNSVRSEFVKQLHRVADFLASRNDIRVVGFEQLER